MKLLRHGVASLVIAAILIGLCFSIYNGIEDVYDIERTYVNNDNKDIITSLEELNIISGINQTVSSIYSIKNPTGNIIDTLGALASTGIGVLKITTGLLIFPFQIMTVISQFYHIPPIVIIGLSVLIVIYVGYILISAYLRGDV